MHRTLLFFGVLFAAAITPFILSKVKNGESLGLFGGSSAKNSAADRSLNQQDSLLPVKRSKQIDPQIAQLLEPPLRKNKNTVEPVVTPLPEVLRFDITPEYVVRRWSRVTTGLPELELDGMRVPLMTGTSPSDLHGSATFFFNRSHQLQRIAIHGYTNAPEPIIEFVTMTYRLKEYAAVGQRLFLAYFEERPLSILRVRNAPISKQSRGAFEVILEINAPIKGAGLSQEQMNFLLSLREANLL